jgi:non-specific serine/threonine protein kinase
MRGQAVASFILGVDRFYARQYEEATGYFKDNISLCRESGDEVGCAQGLGGLASVAEARGDPEMAARLLGAAQHIRDDTGTGYRVRPVEQPLHETSSAAAGRTLGEEVFAREYQEGYALPTAHALELAVSGAGG